MSEPAPELTQEQVREQANYLAEMAVNAQTTPGSAIGGSSVTRAVAPKRDTRDR